MRFQFVLFLFSIYFLKLVHSLGSSMMMSVPPCPPSTNIGVSNIPSVNDLPCYLPVPQNSIHFIALQIPGGSGSSPIVVNFLLNISFPASNEIKEMILNYAYFINCGTNPTWMATGHNLSPPLIKNNHYILLNITTDCTFNYVSATKGLSEAATFGTVLLSANFGHNAPSNTFFIIDCSNEGCVGNNNFFFFQRLKMNFFETLFKILK